MRALFLTLLICSQSLFTSGQVVSLFEDRDYKGRLEKYGPGTKINQLEFDKEVHKGRLNEVYPGFDNKISSVKVPDGLKVTVYEHNNFTGRSKVLTSDSHYLGDDWNDIITSLTVEWDTTKADKDGFYIPYEEANNYLINEEFINNTGKPDLKITSSEKFNEIFFTYHTKGPQSSTPIDFSKQYVIAVFADDKTANHHFFIKRLTMLNNIVNLVYEEKKIPKRDGLINNTFFILVVDKKSDGDIKAEKIRL